MKLSAENIQSNWKVFLHNIETHISDNKDRKQKLLNFYKKYEERIILMPAAFTIPTGKAHWETLVRSRAIENSVFIVATNMCGIHHSGRKTYGHSLLFDPWGRKKNKAFDI